MTTAGNLHRAWRALPEGQLDDIIGSGTCLVLAPHPDDESLGCGGLIAACVAANRPPLVVVLTDGAGSHPGSVAYPPDRLRAVRAKEVSDAVTLLGLPAARLVLLKQPDTAVPHDGPMFDALVTTLTALVDQEPDCTAILAPWRQDPHCDHEAASRLADAVAVATGIRHSAYPVWGWTLADDAPVPDDQPNGVRLDIAQFLPAKRSAIQAHQSQYGGLITDDPNGFILPPQLLSAFDSPFETFLTTNQDQSRQAAHFARLYQASPDPWGFRTSEYEQGKYQRTLDVLPNHRFASGLEVGCSIGILTHMLAGRCDRLLGVDIVEDPLPAARERNADRPWVRFERMQVPRDWPAERFDLIVFSEVLYFLSAADIQACARRVAETVVPGGIVVLVNWLGETDDPSPADAAPDRFIAAAGAGLRVLHQERHDRYRLDLLTPA